MKKMLQLDMNPVLSSVTGEGRPRQDAKLDRNQISVESGAQLTKISWNTDADCEYAWLLLEREYDMRKTDAGYEVTVLTDDWNLHREKLQIAAADAANVTVYQ